MALHVGWRLGFGAMRLSELEESAALRLVHEALDRVVGDSSVDRGFAQRLGFQLVRPRSSTGGARELERRREVVVEAAQSIAILAAGLVAGAAI